MQPTDSELTNMLRQIAHTQAQLYYKPEELHPSPLVVQSVFMLIVAVVTIQFMRAGVTEERFNNLDGIVDEIAHEMQLVGWSLDGIVHVHTD